MAQSATAETIARGVDGEARADAAPRGEFALAGPSACGDRARLPLRGDLAHVRLAGRCFVPHYAVPLPHEVVARVWLQAAAKAEAARLGELPAGTRFEVLDIAGGWAWGQSGHDDLVGYLPLGSLRAL